jgi:putative ABC transport system permease protein
VAAPRLWQLLTTLLLRPTLRRPLLLLASLIGVAAGTAILCALNLANERALRSFEVSAAGLPGELVPSTPHAQLRSPRGRIPTAQLDHCLAFLPRGGSCRGVLQDSLHLPATPGASAGEDILLLGVDGALLTLGAPVFSSALWPQHPTLRLGAGRELRPATWLAAAEPLVILDFPDAWALLAERLPAGARPQPGYDYLEIQAPTWETLAALEASFTFPLRRTTATQQIESQKALTATYRFNLRVLGLVSILIGALLLRNVAALYGLLKRPAVAVLRQLGASRRLVLGLLLIEQGVLGLVGGALGLLLGVRLEAVVSRRVLQTVSDLYVKTAAARGELSPVAAFSTVAAGLLIFLLAGAQTTWQLGRAAPMALRQRAGGEPAPARWAWLRTLALLLLGGAVIAAAPYVPPVELPFLAGASAPQPLLGYLAAGAIFAIAYVLSSPTQHLVAAAASWLTAGPLARHVPTLAIAARRGLRAGGRGRAAVTTLAGGLGLVVGIELMVGGFRESLEDWIGTVFQSDWVSDVRALQGTETRPRLDEADLTAVRALPGIAGADCMLRGDGLSDGRPVRVAGIDNRLGAERPPLLALRTLPGLSAASALALVQKDDRYALISEPLATKQGKAPGDALVLDLGAGAPLRLTVAAVTREYSTELGYVYLARRTFARRLGIDGCHALRIYARPELSAAARARLPAELATAQPALWQRVRLVPNSQVRAAALQTFDQTFAVTAILTALAAALGGLSLLVQVIQSVAERAPELLTLRRLGLTRGGLLRLCAMDVLLAVLAGVLLGLLSGVLLGFILCYAINKQAFGWSVAFLTPRSVRHTLALALGLGAGLWAVGATLAALVLRRSHLRVTRE